MRPLRVCSRTQLTGTLSSSATSLAVRRRSLTRSLPLKQICIRDAIVRTSVKSRRAARYGEKRRFDPRGAAAGGIEPGGARRGERQGPDGDRPLGAGPGGAEPGHAGRVVALVRVRFAVGAGGVRAGA